MEIKFYYCRHCGKIILLLKDTKTPTICCGEEMSELKPKTNEEFSEKHVPVIEISRNSVTVTVGSVLHPSEKVHYIEWITLQTNKGFKQKWIGSEKKPIAHFCITEDENVIAAYAYCNIHKLWKAEM